MPPGQTTHAHATDPAVDGVARVVGALTRSLAELPPGATKLPSVRALCTELRASPLTVQKALAQLSREGKLIAKPGLGTFRLDAPHPTPSEDTSWQALALGEQRIHTDHFAQRLFPDERPGTVDLTSGYPDESLQPTGLLASAMSRAARRPGVWGKQSPEGHPQLRAWFAREVGDCVTANDVVIVPGGQAALMTAFRALARPGDAVLMEAPTYLGAIVAARAAGLRPVPVTGDAGGIRPEFLASTFERTGARVFYAQPTFSNPTGTSLSNERRREVLEIARKAGAFVIEDDYARDLAFEGIAPPPLVTADSGHVVYIRSLTKSTAPSLRIAALCARGQAGARIRSARLVDELFVAGPMQEAALDLVTNPGWHRHRQRVARELQQRRDLAVATLSAAALPIRLQPPHGGYTLWLALPDGVDDEAITRSALARGVRVSSCAAWFPAEPGGAFLRVSYFGATLAALQRGVRAICHVLEGEALPSPADRQKRVKKRQKQISVTPHPEGVP